jgi:outer membrane protein assembly factor BamB
VGALAAADGSVVWTRSLNVAPGTDPPVVGGGRVYVSGRGSLVFDAATGSPQPSVPLSNLSAGPGVLVGTTGGSGIAAVDASTGATRWSIVGPAGTIYGKPAIANGVVYVGSHQEIGDPRVPGGCCAHMAALNLGTGGLLFSFPTQASGGIPTPTSVIVSNGAAYVNAQGNLTALRPAGA